MGSEQERTLLDDMHSTCQYEGCNQPATYISVVKSVFSYCELHMKTYCRTEQHWKELRELRAENEQG